MGRFKDNKTLIGKAGKVKGLTPKVLKQPKKRKRVGKRALRTKFNKRNCMQTRYKRKMRFKINSQTHQNEIKKFQKDQIDYLTRVRKGKKSTLVRYE